MISMTVNTASGFQCASTCRTSRRASAIGSSTSAASAVRMKTRVPGSTDSTAIRMKR